MRKLSALTGSQPVDLSALTSGDLNALTLEETSDLSALTAELRESKEQKREIKRALSNTNRYTACVFKTQAALNKTASFWIIYVF